MKRLLLAIAGVVVLFGVSSTAYAAVSIEASAKISTPDNSYMSTGVGAQVGVFVPIKNVEGLEAGLRLGSVTYDVESPVGNVQIGDNQQTTLDFLARYKGLPAYKSIQPHVFGGIGFTLANDLDSDITGLNLNANKSARLIGGIGVEWVALEAKPVSEQAKPIDSISIRLFADAGVVFSDAKWEVNGTTIDGDNDSFDVSTGISFAKMF